LIFIYPIYNHNWRNISTIHIYITRLASNEIFSPSNKIHWEVGRAKDLSAPLYREEDSDGHLTAVQVTEPLLLQKAQPESRTLFDPVETILLANKFNLFATNSYMLRLFATNSYMLWLFATNKAICLDVELS
jgi:hypothetical protein